MDQQLSNVLGKLNSAIDTRSKEKRLSVEEMGSIIDKKFEENEEKKKLKSYRKVTEEAKPVSVVNISDAAAKKLGMMISSLLPEGTVTQVSETSGKKEPSMIEKIVGKIVGFAKDVLLSIITLIGKVIGWLVKTIVGVITKVAGWLIQKILLAVGLGMGRGALAGGRGAVGRRAKLLKRLAGGLAIAGVAWGATEAWSGYKELTAAGEEWEEQAEQAFSSPESMITQTSDGQTSVDWQSPDVEGGSADTQASVGSASGASGIPDKEIAAANEATATERAEIKALREDADANEPADPIEADPAPTPDPEPTSSLESTSEPVVTVSSPVEQPIDSDSAFPTTQEQDEALAQTIYNLDAEGVREFLGSGDDEGSTETESSPGLTANVSVPPTSEGRDLTGSQESQGTTSTSRPTSSPASSTSSSSSGSMPSLGSSGQAGSDEKDVVSAIDKMIPGDLTNKLSSVDASALSEPTSSSSPKPSLRSRPSSSSSSSSSTSSSTPTSTLISSSSSSSTPTPLNFQGVDSPPIILAPPESSGDSSSLIGPTPSPSPIGDNTPALRDANNELNQANKDLVDSMTTKTFRIENTTTTMSSTRTGYLNSINEDRSRARYSVV